MVISMASIEQTRTGLLPRELSFLLLMLLVFPFLQGNVYGQEEGGSRSVESAVAALISDIESGDFESAFDSHLQIYQRMLSTHSEEAFWELCALKCPYHIGQLGWLRGASVSDLQFLETAINQIEDDTHRNAWRAHLDRFGTAHLGEDARPARSQENTLSLRFHDEASVDQRPWSVVRGGNNQTPMWAIIDTGRAAVHFEQELAEKASLQYRVVTDFYSTREWDGRPVRLQQIILRDLMLGWQSERRVFGGMYDSKTRIGMGEVMALGTMPLLRHDAVCFDWMNRMLHLGYLGPCGRAHRVMPFRAWLHSHAMTPMIEVRRSDGSGTAALVDTGSDVTLCKSVVAREGEDMPFSFGEHGLLTTECSSEAPPIADNYFLDLVIGMETLSKFAAFGWELNPFRMYFVPPSEEDSASFLQQTVAELKSSAQQGDFEGALKAHWRAIRFSLAGEGTAWNEYHELCTDVCTFLGQLAWLAGASPSEFEFLKAYVRAIEDEELQESWRRWVDSILFGHLSEVSQPARKSANVLELIAAKDASGAVRMRTPVRFSGSPRTFHAVVDTGTSMVRFDQAFAETHFLSTRPLTEHSPSKTWNGIEQRIRAVSLEGITLGDQHEPSTLGSLVVGSSDHPEELRIGNRPLLRYEAVCFSWDEGKLYLGELGPCQASGRISARKSLLHPQKLVPTMHFESESNGKVRALLSTGSPSNHCKSELAGGTFSPGDHEQLSVHCDADAERIADDFAFDMIIGMETLAEFSAFGWELNPFRTYFVPKNTPIE